MFSRLKKFIVNKYLLSILRHAMSALGAWLIYIGVDGDQVAEFIPVATQILTGIALYLTSQIGSIVNKKNQKDDK